MKKYHGLLIVFFCVFLLASCVPDESTPHEYGFFGGLVHGLVFPFALFAKLFGLKYGIYAFNNSGFFYWLGYIIGVGGLGGGGGIFARRGK
ncbi:hypothetical protein GVN16_08280 [Emticicia sp. CRIBPO]|uniref:hypothetical protein n=1 Tax=Emticicia sp. CRIBPO TaxID=2683258 RepID=UPI0014126EF8|nr:hypothetical protein [Emticicia sp. CRIBPO]NBA85752.1 hypothetical protein [Emticicia sp. CRIBPO]